jgi:lipopolysaccharide export system permease protein
MTDIQRTRPSFVLEPGRFSSDISGYNILVRKTYENSNKLEGIFIIDNSSHAYSNTLTADSGQIGFSKDNSKMILELYNGEIHQLSKKSAGSDYREIKFEKHIVNIEASGFGFSKSDESAFSRGDRELSADSMRKIVTKIQTDYEAEAHSTLSQIQQLALEFGMFKFNSDTLDSAGISGNKLIARSLVNRYAGLRAKFLNRSKIKQNNQKQTDMYLVEIYKKYSIPFACVVFVLIGAPLGIVTRRGGFGVAAGMSLGFFLLYWACLIGGEKLADRELLSPFLSMWIANFLLGAAGLFLIFRQNLKTIKLFRRIF